MPIIGTPILNPVLPPSTAAPQLQTAPAPCDTFNVVPVSPSPVPCNGQFILSAVPSTLFNQPVLRRMRSVQIAGGQEATISWQMHDALGDPVDLSSCTCASQIAIPATESSAALDNCYLVKLRLSEYLNSGDRSSVGITSFLGDVEGTGQTGNVTVKIPATVTVNPGVYFAEMAITGTDPVTDAEIVMFSNTFYLIINRGMWSKTKQGRLVGGPPTIAEIRLHLRDSAAQESLLLDGIRFADEEIALAIAHPVQYWNEIPPDIRRFNTTNFPFRFHWLDAICSRLFLMVAEWYRANNLSYSAGGISTDDMNKEKNYEAAAMSRWQSYTQFVRSKKTELNLNMCWGGLGSDYGFWYPAGANIGYGSSYGGYQ